MSSPDVRSFTVGPVQENCYLVRADSASTRALIVDPGEEHERLLAGARALGVEIEAILITHCHFDHIGAVAPVALAKGATAPMWSKWQWVMRIASISTPSARAAASSRSCSSPGSTITA